MSKLKKRLLIAAGIIVLLLLLVIPVASFLTKYLIQKYDVEYTGREITLDWAYVNPYTGYVHLDDLVIYEEKSDEIFISMDGLSANMAMLKLFSKTYEIEEIIVSGTHVLNTYLNQETVTQNKLKVGDTLWHRSGDSGFVEDETLYLTGRVAQLIFREDKILSPFVIENTLQNHPAIEIGTLIEKNKRLFLCLELKNKQQKVENLSFDFDYDEVKVFKKIPKDPRHETKVDYGGVRKVV